jgi:hypothetical protein
MQFKKISHYRTFFTELRSIIINKSSTISSMISAKLKNEIPINKPELPPMFGTKSKSPF